MDFIQDDPAKKSLARGDWKLNHENNDLLILGSQVCASGEDSIMIDNTSGMVTKI
jgi:hypothetical protein